MVKLNKKPVKATAKKAVAKKPVRAAAKKVSSAKDISKKYKGKGNFSSLDARRKMDG